MSPQETVETLISSWGSGDMGTVFGLLAEDIVWEDVPHGAVTGMDGVKERMAKMPKIDAVEIDTRNIAANGNVVIAERVDRMLIQEKWRTIRVVGVFEVNDAGKIAAWRDYFDDAEYRREFGDVTR